MSALKNSSLLAALVAAGLLAGCASGVKLDNNTPVETRNPTASTGTDNGASSGTSQSQVASVDLSKSDASSSAGANVPRVVYFDFDSYTVRDDARPVLEQHAKLLKADPKKHEVIEGNTDERGGSEYNLALGQKRAEAVAKSLKLLGVPDSQLEAVSYGKERPAVEGHDESAWSKNRRAELKDR